MSVPDGAYAIQPAGKRAAGSRLRSSLAWGIRAAVTLAACGNAVLAVLSLFAQSWWFADLTIHYRPQYAVFAVVLMVLVLSLRVLSPRVISRRVMSPRLLSLPRLIRGGRTAHGTPNLPGLIAVAASLLTVAICARDAVTVALPSSFLPDAQAHARGDWRIVVSNVFMNNRRFDEVGDTILAEDPDVIALMESGPEWEPMLARLGRRFAYRVQVSDFSDRTVVVLSRWPLHDAVPLVPGEKHGADPVITVRRGAQSLRLAALHGTWPFTAERSRARNVEFEHVAEAARSTALPFVLVGDLNCTALSPHFRSMLVDGGLVDAGAGRGPMPSWPTFFTPLGIRIDHALVARAQVAGLRRLDVPGSDHAGLVVDLDVAR